MRYEFNWSAIMCGVLAIATASVVDMVMHDKPGPPQGDTYTRYNVQVLRTIDEYKYLMRDEDGTIFHAIFCENYEPQFDGGMTLDMLRYQDRGDCWDIRQLNSYVIRRDKHGIAIREHFTYDDPARRPEEATAATATRRSDEAPEPSRSH